MARKAPSGKAKAMRANRVSAASRAGKPFPGKPSRVLPRNSKARTGALKKTNRGKPGPGGTVYSKPIGPTKRASRAGGSTNRTGRSDH